MQYDGRTALVTGAGSGIGRALALELDRRGFRLVLVGRRRDALAETAALLGAGAGAELVAADVTAAEDRQRIAAAFAGGRKLDLLFNNAGVIVAARAAETSDDDLDRLVRTNVVAPFALSRDLLPALLRSNAARIVNIGSVFGDIGYPQFAAYSATKFALRGLSDALRREFAPAGIGVTYAAPRAARTDAFPAFSHLVGPLSLRLDAPESVAGTIVDAALRGRRTVPPRGMERLFIALARFAPSLVDRAIVRQTAGLENSQGEAEPPRNSTRAGGLQR